MGGGGGWAASSIQWHPYIYNVYIVCSTSFVSHSSCRLAATSIISKSIKLLFLKTSNYALQSQILFSTYLKVHVYHIMELLPRTRRGLRGIVFTRSVYLSVRLSVCVCVSVCPADILLFYFSAIRRYIDLKFIQDTYRVVPNSLKKYLHRSKVKVTARYIAFWRYSHITKTEE